MAASSSNACISAEEYDVFISFRGDDTRHNFISHLVSALTRYSIRAYVDNELNKGDDISTSLIKAIHDSHGSLVVFSENYASSVWCLNELLKILESRKQGHFVIPVFYKIDPSHVRKQVASYGRAFAKHEKDSQNMEMLQKWKAALTEAANIAGWDSQSRNNRDESELIQNIVKDVVQKLDLIYQPSESGLVGIDKHCDVIESLMQRFPVIGIWGMGGLGKTTIAKAAFAKLSSQYDNCCFFENVREESQRSGLNQLRDKLLCELLKDDIILINPHKAVGFKYAKRRLSSKKVFIVLDDVSSSKQLEYLDQECNCLGSESRVIITTRDKHLLTGIRVKYTIYEVERLNFEESLRLFKLNAFNENYPDKGYGELSEKFINYAEGNPLALKVLGSFLLSKSREEWESVLRKLKKIPNEDILSVLRLSFDGLNYEEQQIFLDIACFLKGENKEKVINLLDSYGFYGAIGMRTLQDRALITISDHHVVKMHDLIQEMGWEIVRRESIDEFGRRSRLWDPEEVTDVLKYNKGSNAIQGIILDTSQIRDIHLSVDTFKKMTNLRFLKFYSYGYVESSKVHLLGNIESLSVKLRCFHWDGYPLQSLPATLCVEKLVQLHMPYSRIKKLWDGVHDLVNLQSLNLRESEQLTELPDFSKASNLKWVDLSYCTSLCHIHPSILSLHTLETLNLYWCKELTSLQSEVHLNSLKYLEVVSCSNLKEFSLSSEQIRYLDMQGTAIEILDSSIGRCSNLENLTLGDSFKNLSSNLSKLTSLKSLWLIGCRELDTLSLHIALDGLQCLEELHLRDCFNLSQVPDNIKYLSCLKLLNIQNCRKLSYIPELPFSIDTLYATNCTSLETIITPTPLECRVSHYFLKNCVKLDECSLSAIIEDANFRLKQAALCKVGAGNYAHHYFLPGNRVPSWFRYRSKQTMITIEFPARSHFMGFAFYYIPSPEFLPNQGSYFSSCGCDCYLEDSLVTSFRTTFISDELLELISDHVYIWFDPWDCDILFDAMKEHKAKGRSTKKLSFEFFAQLSSGWTTIRMNNAIKECGVWPIYASDYDNSIDEMEQCLGFKLGYRTDDIDEQEQFFGSTAELGPSTFGSGVASYVFDHIEEHEPLLQTIELKEFILKPIPTDISTQNARQRLPEINSSCLLNRGIESGNLIEQECGVCPLDALEYHDSKDQTDLNLELALSYKSKRRQYELEADKQQQFPQGKKFKKSVVQPVPMRLELELNTTFKRDLDTDGMFGC